MSSLYTRATGSQQRMLAIISGAVLNAAHAHPEAVANRRFARSVAKRAVGTISAQWVDLLAAECGQTGPLSGKREDTFRTSRGLGLVTGADDKGRSQISKAAPFSRECRRLGRMILPARMAGDAEAVAALKAAIDALAPLARKEMGKEPT